MMPLQWSFFLPLLALVVAESPACAPGDELCAGEGELSSLLQQQRRHSGGSALAKRDCMIPDMALDALKNGINDVLGRLFTDISQEVPSFSKTFNHKGCHVGVSLSGALNISGLSGLEIKSFECEGGDCAQSMWGFCTEANVGVTIKFGAPELFIEGSGEANLTYEGSCSKGIKHLPTNFPPFGTKVHLVSPELTVHLGAGFQLFPPNIKLPQITPTSFTYDKVDVFECGMHGLESLVDVKICGTYLEQILDGAQGMVSKLLNTQLNNEEVRLQEDIEASAEKTRNAL